MARLLIAIPSKEVINEVEEKVRTGSAYTNDFDIIGMLRNQPMQNILSCCRMPVCTNKAFQAATAAASQQLT